MKDKLEWLQQVLQSHLKLTDRIAILVAHKIIRNTTTIIAEEMMLLGLDLRAHLRVHFNPKFQLAPWMVKKKQNS